jgi:hypothetical protein
MPTAPTGNRMDDGFSIFITFSHDTDFALWETEITPPPVEGGDPIITTTMRNTRLRTKWPKALIDFGDANGSGAYDSAAYQQALAMVNVIQQITITFPDGATLVFWGWLASFAPQSVTEGNQPRANFRIVSANQNASKTETFPVYAASSTTTGTTTTL